jgi:hypothetical protein
MLCLALAITACSSTPVNRELRDPLLARRDAADASYSAAIAQLKSGVEHFDFSQFRFNFTRTRYYAPFDASLQEALKAIDSALDLNKPDICMQIAERALERNYTDLGLHLGAARCALALGESESVEYHKRVFSGLLKSIANSGDGSEAATAFACISDLEWRTFLEMQGFLIVGFEPSKGAKRILAIDVIDSESGAEKTVYVDVSVSLSELQIRGE